jgi:hypothetical protein
MSAVANVNLVALRSRVKAHTVKARTAVVATAHGAPTQNAHHLIQARLASATLAATLVLAPVSIAPAPAFAETCQSSCEAECLKIAPGSKDYCASACTDECSAMKEEGKSDEEMTMTTGAFGSVREKGDFENLLDKMLDSQKVFFVGPSSAMKTQAEAGK